MGWLVDKISDWFRSLLIEGITSNFNGMFNELNTKVGDIATQVGKTPQAWNSGIFNLIRTLSDTVIIPIAGVILTFVLTYELIHMVMERNNMADFDAFAIFKWIFKTFVAVYILTNTFNIVMGIFALAGQAVNNSATIIGNTIDINLSMSALQSQLNAMSTGGLMGLFIESAILSLAMKIVSICIFLIIYARMVEIYLTVSIAPIPFATMANREWGQIGNNYLKGLFALAFQGFLIMVCVAIYAVLLQSIPTSASVHAAVWGCMGYTVLLCFTLFKTGSLSKSLFGAH